MKLKSAFVLCLLLALGSITLGIMSTYILKETVMFFYITVSVFLIILPVCSRVN